MKLSMFAALRRWAPLLGLAATLAACGGGDSSAPAADTLGGIAAVGQPLVGATVAITCDAGSALGTTTGSTGGWQVTISGQTLPCAVQVSGGTVDGVANAAIYHSIASSFGTVNVTPLTDLIVARLVQGDPQTWFADPDFTPVTGAALAGALDAVTTALGLGTALGDLDPLTAAFSATQGDSLDDILEAIRLALAALSTDHAALLAAAGSGDFGGLGGFAAAFTTALADLGGGTPGTCDSGTAMVYVASASGGPFTDGEQVCFTASPTGLEFEGKTLTNPTQNTAVQLPFSAYAFVDGDYTYEVVFNDGVLHEINLVGSSFLGQFAPAASGGGSSLTVEVEIGGVASASIAVGTVPLPGSEAEFCGDIADDPTFIGIGVQGGGTLSITGCSFAANVGTVNATLTLSGVTVAYVVRYRYE